MGGGNCDKGDNFTYVNFFIMAATFRVASLKRGITADVLCLIPVMSI